MGTDDSPRERIGRRPILYGLAGVGVTGAVVGSSSAFAGETTDPDPPGEDEVRTEYANGVSLDQGFTWDAGMEMALTNRMQLDGDPDTDGDRENVLHITSHDEESEDYPCSGVDVQALEVTVADLKDDGTLTYDYYKGKRADYQVPDEVFLILQVKKDDHDEADKRDAVYVIYRKKDAEREGRWETRDVRREFDMEGWRAVRLDDDEVDVNGERVTVDVDVITDYFWSIREQDDRYTLYDHLEGYDHEDVHLLAVAIGNGSVSGRVSDAYFDDLYVQDDAYVWPAMVSMEAQFAPPQVAPGEGPLTVSLSFANPAGEEEGLSLEDVDEDSISLSVFNALAPPVPGTEEAENAVMADGIRNVTGRGVDVEFDSGAVRDLIDGQTTVVVTGAFETDEPRTFAATGDLDEAGQGN